MGDKLPESVKNKSYFSKAIEWYCYRYLSCIAERSWMVLIVSFLLVCLCLLLLNIYLLFPIKRDLNFVKYVNYTEDEFSIIRKLSFNEEDDEYTSIARYLVSKYVETYESSRVIEPEYRENFIQNNSIYKVYQGFQEKMSNETSYLSSSKGKISNINVVKLSIDRPIKDLVTFAGNAVVVFTTEQNKRVKNRTVDISFTLSNAQAALSGIIPFKFIVDGYKYR
ncbi:conjugal transfer protein TraJ [Wolbachia endosymbiont of Mansonella perstans]|uniref:conjugal transfer protein TraJ n=1 Tax=Wolbachia endosymbiont of Mansonella perstans TaxID=229526 RepID=UPI001CE1DC9D|nr:conjugal transfer protein TraJ [Wolbachia endosymbiont of Mansonella perstans]MCA4774361.1 conjugal transfer protein TraJ [Wolbachia endosymbiont of Mansonella perstans]